MDTTLTEVINTHRIVWQYRAKLHAVWPTPDRIDALRFAYTEAGEALDAYLRTIPQYARNNHRNMSVSDELGDCAMMLCTALPEHYTFPQHVDTTPPTLDGICFFVADALLTGEVVEPLVMIAVYLRDKHGLSMAEVVESRLQRIERKVTEAAA